MSNSNSQREVKDSSRLFIVRGSAQPNEPYPANPPDSCFGPTAGSLYQAGGCEAILFRPRLHFADEDLVR